MFIRDFVKNQSVPSPHPQVLRFLGRIITQTGLYDALHVIHAPREIQMRIGLGFF